MPIDPMEFRRTLGRFATGVTIVTTLEGKTDHGMTVNAFTSVSLEPPLVLVCCDKKAESYELMKKSKVFAVNILSDSQKQVSVNFSRHELKAIRFQNLKIRREVTGAAVLQDALAFIDCRVVAIHNAGDHEIFVGQVEKLGYKDGSDPLLFYAGKYRKIGPEI
jgi:flavin reductase (DIM6/NTAB) family NADH-FMN oxidoreductase RutF